MSTASHRWCWCDAASRSPGRSGTWCAAPSTWAAGSQPGSGRTTRSWPRTPATGAAGVEWPSDLRPGALKQPDALAAAPRAWSRPGPSSRVGVRTTPRPPSGPSTAGSRQRTATGTGSKSVAASARHPALGGRQRLDGAHGRADRHGQRPPATPSRPRRTGRAGPHPPGRCLCRQPVAPPPRRPRDRRGPRRRRTPLRSRAWRPGHRPPRPVAPTPGRRGRLEPLLGGRVGRRQRRSAYHGLMTSMIRR